MVFDIKIKGFATLICTGSVLKLSDGHVTGYKITTPWDDFQKELQKLLKSK